MAEQPHADPPVAPAPLRTSSPREVPEILAAIDLGSNSFHLAVARVVGRGIQVIDRVHDRVQLAAGLSEDKHLDEASQLRALSALERFGQRLRDVPSATVRAVGTDALRVAKNSAAFIERASLILGHPIEVISGEEEARLIYRGVAQTMPHEDGGRQLVIDIGGGSTECILGTGLEPEHAQSLHMGCVGFTRQFFADGQITRDRFRRAQIAAQLLFERLPEPYFRADWARAYGSSGTMVTLAEILRLNGWVHDGAGAVSGGITKDGLTKFREVLIAAGHADRIPALQIQGLKPQRQHIIAAGLAIARAALKALPLRQLQPTGAALREGVLYDLLGRFLEGDIRETTIHHLMTRFHVDRGQARRVEQTALALLDTVKPPTFIPRAELEAGRRYLAWAARLHEIGLAISFHGYHKHGAYILANTPLPGFSRDDAQMVSTLVLAHRRKLTRDMFVQLPRHLRDLALKLTLILRLATRIHRSRSDRDVTGKPALEVNQRMLTLSLPDGYLAEHPLTQADFDEEAERLGGAGFVLVLR
ncbi:MAG TPA: Ppx/GppA phosphatase family protein [Myxococcota bacterium]|nr:Ppx/GppA phosphatase family protein [Myxococcota bacterium]